MDKIKFNNFIKRTFIALLAVFIINGTTIVFARAGGGHSSSSHSSSSSSHSLGNGNSRGSIIGVIVFAIITSSGGIIIKLRLGKRKVKSISVIKKLAKSDDDWNYNEIKKEIKETFYKVQDAWMERNQNLAKEYISDKLYNKHESQIEWMKVKKQINILENMVLLGAVPIGIQDFEGINKDCIWVHIKAKAKDYTINEETNEVIEGKVHGCVHFEEYWKFIRNEHRWVLDEIRQIDDIEDLNFFKVEVDN